MLDWSEGGKEIDKEKDATNKMIKSESWTAQYESTCLRV